MDPILILLIPLFYFLPSLLDSIFNRDVQGYILLVNVVLGWTVIYWLVCMYWVFRDFAKRETSSTAGRACEQEKSAIQRF